MENDLETVVTLSETIALTEKVPGSVVTPSTVSDVVGVPLMVSVAPLAVDVTPCGSPVTSHLKGVPLPPEAVSVAE